MKCFVVLLAILGVATAAGPRFAPYYDTTLFQPDLNDVLAKTGQKDFTLAFALGSNEGCVPYWGAQIPIDNDTVLAPIKQMMAQGGQMIIATGGAAGPYLEWRTFTWRNTSEALATAYKRVLDVVGTNHLDVDIEATVNLDVMNQALAAVQQERPDVTVSFTLMVQGENYGLTDALGVDVLVNAKKNNVRVDVVNAMAMEYPNGSPTWGESIVNVANATLYQMKEIWPEKSDTELKKMLGITPMLGRNFNGNVFKPSDANTVLSWATQNDIGYLGFWSIGRDNGDCAEGTLSPICSGTAQSEYEFTNIFRQFALQDLSHHH